MFNLSKYLDYFFIEECIGCERSGKMICNECKNEIKNYKNQKLENTKIIDWVYSPFLYNNPILRKSIFQLKYYFVKKMSLYLADLVYKDFLERINKITIKDNLKNYFEKILIIPIPISKKRLIERNYNQSEEIIKNILKIIKEKENIDLENNLYLNMLLKVKHTIKFAETHSHIERENLIKNAFTINQKYNKEFFENKIIILFDDITTTGATFYEARNTFINFGIKKENIFAFAVAH